MEQPDIVIVAPGVALDRPRAANAGLANFIWWIGILSVAIGFLNLLPIPVLDGGHLLYAVVGRRQFRVARLLWLVLLAGGFVWPGWFLWSLIVLVMGLRHPPVVDEAEPLDRRRRWLAVAALAIFVLCFMPVPISSIAIALP